MDALLGLLAFLVLWMLHRTLRVSRSGDETPGKNDETPGEGAEKHGEGAVIYAFWHGEQQLILPARPRRRLAVMTSLSADGQLQARVLRRFEFHCVSGSSSRGGARGLLELAREVRAGSSAALAVDGPRGPRHVAKSGAIQLARMTGAPIVPVRATAHRVWRAKRAWDKFEVPLPFARLEVTFGAPLEVPRDARRDEVDALTHGLTRRLIETGDPKA